MNINMTNKVLYRNVINNIQRIGRKYHANIPIELLYVDESYQRVQTRSMEKIRKMANLWDDNKMDELTVVAHPEEYRFAVTDGYGRLTASQMQSEPYESLDCCVILDAPKDPLKRRKFEADLFVKQTDCLERVSPAQKHNANLILEVPEVMVLEKVLSKYNIKISRKRGHRPKGYLGNYAKTLAIGKVHGEDCLDWIFNLLTNVQYNMQTDGYCVRILQGLASVWANNPLRRREAYNILSKYMKGRSPIKLVDEIRVAYPGRDSTGSALYMNALVAEKLKKY